MTWAPFHFWVLLSNVTASEGPSQNQPILHSSLLAPTSPFFLVMEFINSEITLSTTLLVDCLPSLELKTHGAATLLFWWPWQPEGRRQRFSVWSMDSLKWTCKVESLLPVIVRLYLLFPTILIFALTVRKMFDTLAWIKATALAGTSSHCIILHHHTFTVKRKEKKASFP